MTRGEDRSVKRKARAAIDGTAKLERAEMRAADAPELAMVFRQDAAAAGLTALERSAPRNDDLPVETALLGERAIEPRELEADEAAGGYADPYVQRGPRSFRRFVPCFLQALGGRRWQWARGLRYSLRPPFDKLALLSLRQISYGRGARYGHLAAFHRALQWFRAVRNHALRSIDAGRADIEPLSSNIN